MFSSTRTFGFAIVLPAAILWFAWGCSMAQQPDRQERLSHGYVYYFDGAGGGGAVMNWGSGVKKGLLDAGFEGAGEIFPWNTGAGVVADQDSSVEYKRSKAGQAAREIQAYAKKYPG